MGENGYLDRNGLFLGVDFVIFYFFVFVSSFDTRRSD